MDNEDHIVEETEDENSQPEQAITFKSLVSTYVEVQDMFHICTIFFLSKQQILLFVTIVLLSKGMLSLF